MGNLRLIRPGESRPTASSPDNSRVLAEAGSRTGVRADGRNTTSTPSVEYVPAPVRGPVVMDVPSASERSRTVLPEWVLVLSAESGSTASEETAPAAEPLPPPVPESSDAADQPSKTEAETNAAPVERMPRGDSRSRVPEAEFEFVVPVQPPAIHDPHEPIMTYTRIFDGREADLQARLRDYVELTGDDRSGGWRGYLQRSEDFIRFTSHVMVFEMLTLHGGQTGRRHVWTWWRKH